MIQTSPVGIEMPRYVSHKTVWALKIKEIEFHKPTIAELEAILDGDAPETPAATITPEDKGYASFGVTTDYVSKHNPQTGGYFVVYKDGYESFSPAVAFEEGYTRI